MEVILAWKGTKCETGGVPFRGPNKMFGVGRVTRNKPFLRLIENL